MSGSGSSAEMRRELGSRLRELRLQAGLSQQQVARRTGCRGRSTVSNAEAGGYARRQFWERCDELFGTGGLFARGYDEAHQEAGGPPDNAREVLELLRDAGDPGAAPQALAAYQKLGWPVEKHEGRLLLVTGTVIDALELPRPAGALAARWWLYSGGRADEVRGLPALPRPDQALAVIDTGHSFFFIAQASGPWHAPGIPAPAGAPRAAGPAIRWHCLGSRIPLPPSVVNGRPADWAHLPSQRMRLSPAIGLLDLLAKAAAAGLDAGVLTFPHEVLVIPVRGQPSPAPAG
ncbi:MAG: helix-turn-helix transcriptional regulator [Streptosporangiaceae bacterium]